VLVRKNAGTPTNHDIKLILHASDWTTLETFEADESDA
jgi:hypothetical protein